MEPVTIVVLAVIGIIIAIFAIIVAAVSIYALLNPRTAIENFEVSASHVCQSANCGIFVKFKIVNIYDDTTVSLQVFRDGLPLRFLVEGASVEEFNEFFLGIDTRLFDRPGAYDLQLLLGGNIGYHGPAGFRQLPPGPLIARQTVTLLARDTENRVRYQASASALLVEDRQVVSDEAVIASEPKKEEVGDFNINCKYTELQAITLVESAMGQISQAGIDNVKFIDDSYVQNGEAGFLSPQDDPAFESHPTEVDISIVTSDGSTTDLGRLVVGQTSTLVAPIALDQTIRILGSRRSGPNVPFFPERPVIWQIDLHVYCV